MSLKPGEVDLGTTIMAVKYANGVILGADTRSSMGIYVGNRATDKLTPLHKKIYCCRSGSAADTQALADMVRTQLESHAIQLGRAPTTKSAATLFQRYCYEYKDRLVAGIIVAGYDKQRGGSVYNIPLGGACVEQDFAVSGSGSSYIYGYCDANYRPDMSEAECLQFVRNAVSHAVHRDGSSGGNIRTMVLNAETETREYLPGDQLPYPPPLNNTL